MADIPFEPRSEGDAHVKAVVVGDELLLHLSGSAEPRDTTFLDGVLTDTHDAAERIGASTIVVDVRALEFMNSTSFKSFLKWIARIVDADEPAPYRIRFLANDEFRWQRRSLEALRCFAVELIEVA